MHYVRAVGRAPPPVARHRPPPVRHPPPGVSPASSRAVGSSDRCRHRGPRAPPTRECRPDRASARDAPGHHSPSPPPSTLRNPVAQRAPERRGSPNPPPKQVRGSDRGAPSRLRSLVVRPWRPKEGKRGGFHRPAAARFQPCPHPQPTGTSTPACRVGDGPETKGQGPATHPARRRDGGAAARRRPGAEPGGVPRPQAA